jgi:BlaI family transcriptional regulator, penicillinase repressor
MPRSVTLTRRELDIMSALWKAGNATVGEIREALPDDLAYPTVQTMLRVLETKGFVRHEQDGRAFRFYPRIAPDDAGDGALKRLVTKVYQGSRELLMSRLIADEDISPEELKRMKKILQQRIEESSQ